MDDPNITMEEYIRLEEEMAQKRRKVFNWETAKYGKIWYDEDVYDLRFVETEFPVIVFNDNLTSNETPSSIVYNDALTFKSNFSTEPILCPQHIDKFDFKDETSLFEYDEEEQNALYFNDLFPFNIIYPDDLKSIKGDDDNEIDMIQSLGDMALSLREQRHQYLRYEGLQYTNVDIANFETRLARIYKREVYRVQAESMRRIYDKGDQSAYWVGISPVGDFLGTPPSYTLIRDPMMSWILEIICFWEEAGGDDIWRQEGDVGGVVEEAPVAPEGGDKDEEMPQAVPPPPRTQGESLTWLMDNSGVPYKRYSESPVECQRRTRQGTEDAITSTAPQQPDP
nr:hypothetical protein [Tanacetum cinerariifolium]